MTKRRAKGEGSVYRCKDGRVVGAWVDANGRKRYITSKTKSKIEIKVAIRRKLEERDAGIAYDSFSWTSACSHMHRLRSMVMVKICRTAHCLTYALINQHPE